ncbi:BCL-2-associated athanogene 5 [Hordeum vulgare]|nr:BCL-2-associated athanogene 5 [Hordeum vulgare]
MLDGKPSKETTFGRVQAAARGHMARRMVREVRAAEREAVAARVAAEADALRAVAKKRVGLGEELMRLLLRLDGVRGAREYRRRVARRVLAFQDAVDALESSPSPALAPAVVTADVPVVQDAEEEVGDAMVPELQDADEEAEDAMAPELPVEDDNAAGDPLATAVTTETAALEIDVASPVVVDEADQTETGL